MPGWRRRQQGAPGNIGLLPGAPRCTFPALQEYAQPVASARPCQAPWQGVLGECQDQQAGLPADSRPQRQECRQSVRGWASTGPVPACGWGRAGAILNDVVWGHPAREQGRAAQPGRGRAPRAQVGESSARVLERRRERAAGQRDKGSRRRGWTRVPRGPEGRLQRLCGSCQALEASNEERLH